MRLLIRCLCLCFLHLAVTNVEDRDRNDLRTLKHDAIAKVIYKEVERVRRKRAIPAAAVNGIVSLLSKVVGSKLKGGLMPKIGSNVTSGLITKLVGNLLGKIFSGKTKDQIHDELTKYLTEWQKKSDKSAAELGKKLKGVIDSLAKKNSDMLNKKAKIEIIPQKGMHLGDMFSPAGYKIRTSYLTIKSEPDSSSRSAYGYDSGIGNVIINGCYQPSLTVNDPCHDAKRLLPLCSKMLEGTTFIGVGFDGRGTYTSSSRRKSVIQRICLKGGSYDHQGVPDSMTVHGIYDTDVKTMTFSSMSRYQRYLEKKAAVAKSGYMFLDAVRKAYGTSSGGFLGFGSGSSSSSHSESHSSSQSSSSHSYHSFSQGDHFRQMYMSMLVVDVARYEIFMDDVKPHDLNMDFLHDLVSLPTSYFSAGGPQKFQNFLLRYGTHYIKSAKFGGSLRLFKVKQGSKTESIEQFSRKAQADYRAMFSTYQASVAQYKSRGWFRKKENGSSKKNSQSNVTAGARVSETQSSDKEVEQQKYSNEVLTVEGGDQKIAAVISEMYTVGFKHELVDWLQSIPTYPKPIEFQMAMLSDLCNINYKHLFPAGVVDFGCFGREKLLMESGTNRKYYMWNTTNINDDKTTYVKSERRYCDFSNQKGLEKAMMRRCRSLRRAIDVYLEEGPVPVNDIHLPPGRAGCETNDLSYDDVRHDLRTPTWDKLTDGRQFKVIFDMPDDIRGVTERSSILTAFFRKSNKRWYVKNADGIMHLYDGWGNGGSSNVKGTDKKMSLRGLVLSYDTGTGLLQLTQADYTESVKVLPDLSSNLTNKYLARVEYLHILNEIQKHKNEFGIGSVPCNVVWSNAHRFNPAVAGGRCISFAAISAGDIFVVFAAIPRDETTWYYVQISPNGVAIYKGFRIMKFIDDRNARGLGDNTLFQLYFVCVKEESDQTTILYGKTIDTMERGHVYGSFHDSDTNIQVRFYAFGNGAKEVEIMDAHVLRTAAMGEHVCVGDTIQFEGKCIEDCHPQCIGCHRPDSSTSCRKCRHYKLDHKCVAACPSTHRAGPDNITCTCKVIENGVCVANCSDDRMPVEKANMNQIVHVCVCRFFHPDSEDSCLPGCPLTTYSKKLPNAQTECLICDGVCKPQEKGVPVCTGPTHTGCTDCFTLPGQTSCIVCGAGSYLGNTSSNISDSKGSTGKADSGSNSRLHSKMMEIDRQLYLNPFVRYNEASRAQAKWKGFYNIKSRLVRLAMEKRSDKLFENRSSMMLKKRPIGGPNEEPIEFPKRRPIDVPKRRPIDVPKKRPIDVPKRRPIDVPKRRPIDVPKRRPIDVPERRPIDVPTRRPIDVPKRRPIDVPTRRPIDVPKRRPVDVPKRRPIEVPTRRPIEVPTRRPIEVPTRRPIDVPKRRPIDVPTRRPIDVPKRRPVDVPKRRPIEVPKRRPIEVPTRRPIEVPKRRPLYRPECENERYNRLTRACCMSKVEVSVYSRFTQKCCSFGVVDRSQSCFRCGRIPYNPSTHGCCNNRQYSKTSQKCCSYEFIVSKSENCPMCGGIGYNPLTHGCCGSNSYLKTAKKCCPLGIIVRQSQNCPTCGSISYNPLTHGCCGRKGYSKTTEKCCPLGVVVSRSQNCPKCGSAEYNPNTHGCCSNRRIYVKVTQKCCPLGVISDRSQLCPKCGGTSYNPATHGCCDKTRFSKTTQKCCPLGVVVGRTQNCPRCGSVIYNPGTHGCCQSKTVFSKTTQTCCSSGSVVGRSQSCPRPKRLLPSGCKACTPGYRCPGDGRRYICSIQLNQKSTEGGRDCVACPSGSWSTIPPSQSCHRCSPGFYKKTASSRCIQCPGKTAGRNCQVTCKCLYGRCIKVDGSCSCWRFFKGHRCEIPTDGALRLVDDRIVNQYIAIAERKVISGKVKRLAREYSGSMRHHPSLEFKPKVAVIEEQLRALVVDKQLRRKFKPLLQQKMDFSGEIRGRLEVYHNGQWGTVCGHKWTDLNTKVACRQFSYKNGIVKTNAFYGAGRGPIWIKWIRCLGYEHRLLSCPRRQYWIWSGQKSSTCRHAHDIGLICY